MVEAVNVKCYVSEVPQYILQMYIMQFLLFHLKTSILQIPLTEPSLHFSNCINMVIERDGVINNMHGSMNFVINAEGPLDVIAYYLKISFPISHSKHMLLILKRII